MPILRRNIEFGPVLRSSAWRKVAIGTWRSAGDPSVYGLLELDVGPALAYIEARRTATGQKITLTHFMGKALALVIARNPEINCMLRFGRLHPRRDVDIFFQVASDDAGRDLSGLTIRRIDQKPLEEIAREMQAEVETVRAKGDPAFRRMKGTMGLLPGFLASWALKLSGFLLYGLNLWTPLLGVPRDPFGSAMITSIGPLGLDVAFAPLVPYSRVPLVAAFGAVRDMPVARDGKVVIARMAPLCVTFDHRLIDGMHASKMVKTLKAIFENPERELG